MKNQYELLYQQMHLCQHTYDTEKALVSRQLGSKDLRIVHNAQLRLDALEREWQKYTGKINQRCLNR